LIPAKVQVADHHRLVRAQGIHGEVAAALSGGKAAIVSEEACSTVWSWIAHQAVKRTPAAR
jgi:hypothetical protein